MEITNLKTTDPPVARALEFAARKLGRTAEDILAEVTREPLDDGEIGFLVACRVDALVDQEV